MMEWISVKDRLPEKDKEYPKTSISVLLAFEEWFVEEKKTKIEHAVGWYAFDSESWHFDDSGHFIAYPVLYWSEIMPLPEPPEEE